MEDIMYIEFPFRNHDVKDYRTTVLLLRIIFQNNRLNMLVKVLYCKQGSWR